MIRGWKVEMGALANMQVNAKKNINQNLMSVASSTA